MSDSDKELAREAVRRGAVQKVPELEGLIGLVGEIRAEIDSGEHSRHHLTMREWLEEPCAN